MEHARRAPLSAAREALRVALRHAPRRGVAIVSIAMALGACDAPRQVSDSGFGAFEVSLAADDDGLAVAWYDNRDRNAELYLRLADRDGGFSAPAFRATKTAGQSYEPDAAKLGNEVVLAWYETAADGARRARLGAWGPHRERLWVTALAAAGGESRNPVVRARGDELFCAWIEADSAGREYLWAGSWDRDGKMRLSPVRVAPVGATTWNLNAAVTDDAAYVVYDAAQDGGAEELYVAVIADGHAEARRLTVDDGFKSKYPDIAIAGDRVALTWFDERDGNREVYLATGPVAELDGRLTAHARRVTTTPGQSIGAYLAWNRGRIGLAWSDDTTGNYEVWLQRFDGDAVPLGPAQQLTDNPTSSLIPAIRPWHDGFAVAWNELEPSAHDVHGSVSKSAVVIAFVR